MIGGVLSAVALAWSGVLASTAVWAAIRSRRRPSVGRGGEDRALLIRPCAGEEPSLLRALASTEHAARLLPLSVRFAVASIEDAAFPIAESVRAGLRARGLDAEICITGAVGPNRKADQLARTLGREASRARLVIVADSDVDLAEISFDELTAPFADPIIGAVWVPPVETSPRTLADRASASVLDGSFHAFPVLAAIDPGGMVGKLVAIRRDALDEVGGFGALVGYLGEDMELARRLREAGWKIRSAPFVVPSLAQGRSWGQAVQRYARWINVIRAQRPHLMPTYPAILFATPFALALALVAAWLGGPLALVAALVVIGSRVFVGCLARLRSGRPSRWGSLALDMLLADALLIAAFVRAVGSRRTVWRGVELHPDPRSGTLTEVP